MVLKWFVLTIEMPKMCHNVAAQCLLIGASLML